VTEGEACLLAAHHVHQLSSKAPTRAGHLRRAHTCCVCVHGAGLAASVQVPSSGDGEVAAVDLRFEWTIHHCHIHVLLPIPNPKPEPSPLLPYPVATADVVAMPKFSDLCDSALALDAHFSNLFCIALCRVCRNIIKNCRSGKQGDMAGTWRAQNGPCSYTCSFLACQAWNHIQSKALA
jgi:hypothetical protein